MIGKTYGGMPVFVSPALPMPPTHQQVARRLVRHGMAEILKWLGEEVGPKPGDQVHAVLGMDPARPAEWCLSGTGFVSAELYERLTDGGAA